MSGKSVSHKPRREWTHSLGLLGSLGRQLAAQVIGVAADFGLGNGAVSKANDGRVVTEKKNARLGELLWKQLGRPKDLVPGPRLLHVSPEPVDKHYVHFRIRSWDDEQQSAVGHDGYIVPRLSDGEPSATQHLPLSF